MNKLNIANFLLFQVSWLVCVLSGAAENNAPAIMMTLLFVIVHFRFFPWKRTDVKLIFAGLLIGLILDSSWSALGLMSFAGQSLQPLAPWWILCLWVNFMLTLNHSLAWLLPRRRLAALLAAIGSPVSYYAGQQLGALEWQMPGQMFVAASLSWAVVVPLLLTCARAWRKQEQRLAHAVA